jgi:hypothetical protein
MVAASMGSFLNIEQSVERFMMAAAIGVLLLVLYQAIVMIAAVLATRSDRDEVGAASAIDQSGRTG